MTYKFDPLFTPINREASEFSSFREAVMDFSSNTSSCKQRVDDAVEEKVPLLFDYYGLCPEIKNWKALAYEMAHDFFPGFMDEIDYEKERLSQKRPANAPTKWGDHWLALLWCEVEEKRKSGLSVIASCKELVQNMPWEEKLRHIHDNAGIGNVIATRAERLRQYYYQASKTDLVGILRGVSKASVHSDTCKSMHQLLYTMIAMKVTGEISQNNAPTETV